MRRDALRLRGRGGGAVKQISFAWTTPALLAGRKTCTRREWADRHARQFHEGELVAAYDRQTRAGGKQVATIRLTAAPVYTNVLTAGDWKSEGFGYLQETGAKVNGQTPATLWRTWVMERPYFWVVRFELEER